MRIGYIKKQKVPLKMMDKFKYYCGIVTKNELQDGCVFRIPLLEQEEKMSKVIRNLLKQIQKAKIDAIVFSRDCICYPFYFKMKEALEGYTVLTGKRLMHYMNYEILEYILKIQNTTMKQEDVFFMIKKDKNLDLQFLSKFVENCKTVNIVTNDIERFKNVQDNLYEKENILISVSNNKSKSLKRAKYILNINMEQKEFEKFKVNRDAIIINLGENTDYHRTGFDGICVQYFEIHIPDEYIEHWESIDGLDEFDNVRLYESILLMKIESAKQKVIMLSKEELYQHKNMVENMIKDDDIYIIGLIGNNGRICEEEFKKISKK